MFKTFHASNANSVWHKIATEFTGGNTSAQISRAGDTQEILHAAISISNPRERWVVSKTPSINPALAIAEVIWIMNGRNDSSFLNYFCSILPNFAGKGRTYHGAYGYRLRRQFGIDQLDRAYNALKHKPESRQVVLQIWDGRLDLPRVKGKVMAADIPCNLISMLKVRSGKLEWTQILRSNDVFRGLPYNFVQFTTMQEIVAGWLGLEIGSYNQISDSLHVYDENMADIKRSSYVVAARNNDFLGLSKGQSRKVFLEMAEMTEQLVGRSVNVQQLGALLRAFRGPQAYRNMMTVLCAEVARRHKETGAMWELIGNCTNPIYVQLFRRWVATTAKSLKK